MANDAADPRDADGAALGVPTGPADPTAAPPSDQDDEQSARRSKAGKPGDDSGKHYEPL